MLCATATRPKAGPPETLGHPTMLFCSCRKASKGPMILCDLCEEWFHYKCAGVTQETITDDEQWLCFVCTRISQLETRVTARFTNLTKKENVDNLNKVAEKIRLIKEENNSVKKDCKEFEQNMKIEMTRVAISVGNRIRDLEKENKNMRELLLKHKERNEGLSSELDKKEKENKMLKAKLKALNKNSIQEKVIQPKKLQKSLSLSQNNRKLSSSQAPKKTYIEDDEAEWDK